MALACAENTPHVHLFGTLLKVMVMAISRNHCGR